MILHNVYYAQFDQASSSRILSRKRRINAIGTQLVAVVGSQFDVRSHGWIPLVVRKIQRAGSGWSLSAYFRFSALKFSVLN